MIEERFGVLNAPFESRVASENKRTEIIARVVKTGVAPRAYYERHAIVVLVLRLQRPIYRWGTVTVFLIPLPYDQHCRHSMRPVRKPFIDGL